MLDSSVPIGPLVSVRNGRLTRGSQATLSRVAILGNRFLPAELVFLREYPTMFSRPNTNSLIRSNRRKGASAVEFAIVAPIFFMVVLGIIEFGRMAMVQQVITNAAREGARIAVLDGSTKAKVETKVNDYLTAASVSTATVSVNPDPPSTAGFDQPVTVNVSIPFDDVSWLPTSVFLGGKSLQATVVMRRETVE